MTPGANMSGVNADKWWANVEAEMRVFEDAPDQQGRSLWYIFWPSRFPWRSHRTCHPLRVADDPDDRKLLPQGQQEPQQSCLVGHHLRSLDRCDLRGARADSDGDISELPPLNELATSAGFNVAFFLLLVVFAISFLWEASKSHSPQKWTNKMDSKVDSTTGYLSLFFMAFTLVLVSFSCTGPIIGTLLVEAASTSNFISPAIGMFGFALALAIPLLTVRDFPDNAQVDACLRAEAG